jgi:hypothetical protein
MIARILSWLFFSSSRLRLAPEDLAGVLRYDSRRHRAAPPVESEASHAMPMMLYRAEPGKYVGLGTAIIKERRREKRKVLDKSPVL